jgi:hypothetical protein
MCFCDVRLRVYGPGRGQTGCAHLPSCSRSDDDGCRKTPVIACLPCRNETISTWITRLRDVDNLATFCEQCGKLDNSFVGPMKRSLQEVYTHFTYFFMIFLKELSTKMVDNFLSKRVVLCGIIVMTRGSLNEHI